MKPMPSVLAAVALLASGALALSAAMPAAAQPAVKAKAAWSMVPQSKDANGDGFIDGDGGVPSKGALSSQPSTRMVGAGNHIAQPNERLIGGALSWYLKADGFPVSLDACASKGAEYRWTIRQGGQTTSTTSWRALKAKTCQSTVSLPEGGYTFVLDVRDGKQSSSTTITAQVTNYLVVAMGDSYASGEGNPRNVEAWLAGGGGFTPYWDDNPCHRSVRAGVAQAALRLEESSPHSSVTFVDVTCSGATVDAGILGAQRASGQATSQLEQARTIIGDAPVDIALLTIGGNDIGFTSILTSCALATNCPISKAVNAPLNRYPTVQTGVQALTGDLTADYAHIAACLGGTDCQLAGKRPYAGLTMSPRGAVLPVMYPDITRDTSGQPCSYLTLSQSDFGWARDTVLVPNPQPAYDYVTDSGTQVSLPLAQGTLNGQIGATGSMLGWHPVQRAWSASGESPQGHGVCAQDPWVFRLTALSAMPEASFHPNPAGHQALGKAIAGAMQIVLK